MRLVSIAIYAAVFGTGSALVAFALLADSMWAWSVGIVYIAYDTALLLLIARLVWPATSRALPPPQPVLHSADATGEAAVTRRLSLGVVIAAYNEAAILPETLTALCAQIDRPELVLIVDDGSTDDTARSLGEHFGLPIAPEGLLGDAGKAYPFIRLMRMARSGKAAALNAALLEIDTDIIVAIDADTALAPDATAAIRAAFEADPSLVGAGGLLVPVCDPGPLGRALQWFQTYEYIRSMVARFAWMSRNCLVLISGAFSAFRRDALVRVGGFDTDCVVEDYELTHRMHRYAVEHGLGWRLQMITGAHALTHAPGAFGAFMMQRRRWFAGYLQTQFWNRDLAGQRRFGALGTMMMPIKAFDTLQPVYGFAAFLLVVGFAVTGRTNLALAALGILGAKIAADLLLNVWMVHAYRKLTGDTRSSRYSDVIIATVLEPFSFQPLRQAGAAWGWISFLTGRYRWGRQTRTALATGETAAQEPAKPQRSVNASR